MDRSCINNNLVSSNYDHWLSNKQGRVLLVRKASWSWRRVDEWFLITILSTGRDKRALMMSSAISDIDRDGRFGPKWVRLVPKEINLFSVSQNVPISHVKTSWIFPIWSQSDPYWAIIRQPYLDWSGWFSFYLSITTSLVILELCLYVNITRNEC